MRYTIDNIPNGDIFWWGYFEKGWKKVSPAEALKIMRRYMSGLDYQEFDRMVREGLSGNEIKLMNGGSRFKFIPK